MTFTKILIANRGDIQRAAQVAAQAHAGVAGVTPEPNAWRAQRAAIEPRSHHVS